MLLSGKQAFVGIRGNTTPLKTTAWEAGQIRAKTDFMNYQGSKGYNTLPCRAF